MWDTPKTKEEAKLLRYGVWSGNPNGYPYNPARCAYEISTSIWNYTQCSRKNGHGPDEMYCKQHAKMVGV